MKQDHLKVEGIHTNKRFKRKSQNTNNYRRNQDKFSKSLSIPFLVKTYWRFGEIKLDELNDDSMKQSEVLLYLFMGSTMRDIIDQIKFQANNTYRRDLQFKLNTIYLDQYGILKKKEIGVVHSVKTKLNDDKQLKDSKFKIGDMLAIEITQIEKVLIQKN